MERGKGDILYLKMIKDAIESVAEYVSGYDEDTFLRDSKTRDACLMQLIVIGESGGKVSDGLKKNFREVEWQLMKAILPVLQPKIEHIIEVLENENNGKIN